MLLLPVPGVLHCQQDAQLFQLADSETAQLPLPAVTDCRTFEWQST